MFDVKVIGSRTGKQVTPRGLKVKLEKMRRKFKDMRPIWKQLAPQLYKFMTYQFAHEGAWGGSRWARLNPSYAAYKAEVYAGQSILVATGRLFSSLTAKGGGNILRMKPKFMEFGTKVPYGIFHQTGTRKMPRRPILPSIKKLVIKGKLKSKVERVAFDRVRKVWIQ